MTTCKRLTIFEGPDGAGKTTAAQVFAAETGARYVHFGPCKNIDKGLPRLYIEAMLPALLGYQDVVFDRCWLSEVPYGVAFRHGQDRIGNVYRRMLERVAMRCATTVILAQPPWETVVTNYLGRKDEEYLDNELQLRQVYDHYSSNLSTALPVLRYDYTVAGNWFTQPSATDLDIARTKPHRVETPSAGALGGYGAVIIGEKFAEPKEHDPLYQSPFVSFSGSGCSKWLTEQLDDAGIGEEKLLWVNADELQGHIIEVITSSRRGIFALGDVAERRVRELGLSHFTFNHPQSWKRFNASATYPLIPALKEYFA